MITDRLGTAQWADPDEVARQYAYHPGAFWLGKTLPAGRPVGIEDDRHVCVVAGTRAGKGASVLIPNLQRWPGSVVAVDPTGDVATETAAHRAKVFGQKVFVLDPYGIADVDETYRASFNPLAMLDPGNRGVVRDAERIASSLVPPDDKEEAWAQNGARRLLAALILHVLTAPEFEGRRNLVTVRELVYRGDTMMRDYLRAKGRVNIPSPFALLWSGMALNDRFNGQIAGAGEEFERMSKAAPAQWTGVHDVALSATNFINNEDMRDCLTGSDFDIASLKTDPKGVSLYLTIPSRDKVEDFRWLRLMITLLLTHMETIRSDPAAGHPVLFLLDEFAGLQKMDRLAAGIAEIAKYGVKLCIVLQNLGQLKNVYDEGWESFLANCGARIFFGVDDQFTREYVSSLIGETEIVRYTDAATEGSSTSSSSTDTKGASTTRQESSSKSKGDSYKRSILNLRDTVGILRRLSGNAMASDVTQTGSSEGSATEESRAESATHGAERSSTRTEQLFKRPLVTPDEVGKLFQRISDRSNPLYPGAAICLLGDYPDPLMLRRVNYFDNESDHAADIAAERATETVTSARGESPSPSVEKKPAAAKPPKYTGGARVELPFRGVALRVLHDDRIAVVGGSKGELAAIDIESGEVLDKVNAETPTIRPGGGENKYLGDLFYLLELDDHPNVFRTMSHQGNLKLWTYDGGLRLLQAADVLSPHQQTLSSAILAARRSRNWSTWSVYNREMPERLDLGIVEAKLSPDRQSILCLTSWFAVYRCSVYGEFLDGPVVIPDAFNIEPANADASEFWAGRSMSVGARDVISLHSFSKGEIRNSAPRRASFGSNGIYSLGDRSLYAGGAVIRPDDFSEIDGAEFILFTAHEPTRVIDKGMLLAPVSSMICVYDSETLKKSGDPLIGGHEGDVLRVAVTHDRTRAVSISRESLCIWDLVRRKPMGGGRNAAQETLVHNVIGNYSGYACSAKETVLYPGYQQTAIVNIDCNKAVSCGSTDGASPVGITGDENFDNLQVVALASRPAKLTLKAPGVFGKILKREVDVSEYLLKQYRYLSGSLIPYHELLLGGPDKRFGGSCEPRSDNTAVADLGHGRLAMLTAGHLLIYNTQTRAITQGPKDISGPSGDDEGGYWTFYTQMAVTPDGEKLIVRGKDLPIRVYDTRSFSLLGEIKDTADRPGLLLPLSDNRHFLFSKESKHYSEHNTFVLMADMSTRSVLGVLRDLQLWHAPEEATGSCLLANGAQLAIAEYNAVKIYPLLNADAPQEMTIHGDSIGVVRPALEGRGISTVSSDGTAKRTDLGLRLEDADELISALQRRAKESGIIVPQERY